MLKIENLYVSYSGIEAVKGISLEVPDQSIVTLIGANGAGNLQPPLLPIRQGAGHLAFEVFQAQHPQQLHRLLALPALLPGIEAEGSGKHIGVGVHMLGN